jgi:hypothetical protein
MSDSLNTSKSNSSTTITSLSDNVSFINEKLIQKISTVLENVIKLNNSNSSNLKKNKNIFNCDEIPDISLYNYLFRIQKYLSVEDNTLILALIYIDRICKDGKYMVNSYNIHKILFVAIILAIKFNEDIYYTNKYCAQIGGVSSGELEKMEIRFAFAIQFNFYVEKSLYDRYYNYINKI